MIQLSKTLNAWQHADFIKTFKQEVAALEQQQLPLQQGLSLSSYVSNEKHSAIIQNTTENTTTISIKAGIFYTGIIAGCSCSDDPTPLDTQNEYCELIFVINKQTAKTTVSLID